MSGPFQLLLAKTDARVRAPGEWVGYCLHHDDRGGNRSLDIDFKAKDCDISSDGTEYPRLYIRCRSCNARGTDVATALGVWFDDLEADAIATDLPTRQKRPWRIARSSDIEEWANARQADPEATRWLIEDRLLTADFIDTYQVGWRADRRWWTFPLLWEGVPWGCLWYPADPLNDGRRKMCPWGGQRPALYPDVPDSPVVLLVEGELDAAVGRCRGLPTVSGTLGAGAWDERLTEELRGRSVIVTYDCDKAGRSGAADRVRDFKAAGIPARLHDLDTTESEGFDLTDWFREGRTVERLRSDLRDSRTPGRSPRVPLNAAHRSPVRIGGRS